MKEKEKEKKRTERKKGKQPRLECPDLCSPTMRRVGEREKYLLSIVPPLQGVLVGRCLHTCRTRVNMGKKNFERIGMRSHYVSSPVLSRPDSRLPVRTPVFPSAGSARSASSTIWLPGMRRLASSCGTPCFSGTRSTHPKMRPTRKSPSLKPPPGYVVRVRFNPLTLYWIFRDYLPSRPLALATTTILRLRS